MEENYKCQRIECEGRGEERGRVCVCVSKRVDTCHWSVDSHGQINGTHLLILWKSVSSSFVFLFHFSLFLSLSLSLSLMILFRKKDLEESAILECPKSSQFLPFCCPCTAADQCPNGQSVAAGQLSVPVRNKWREKE